MPRTVLVLILMLMSACAGDETVVREDMGASGPAILDGGLEPIAPGPLDEPVAWATTSGVDAARIVWTTFPANDPSAFDWAAADTTELVAVAVDGGVTRWEAILPRRGSDRGRLFWFEAESAGERVALPDDRSSAPLRVEAIPFELSGAWPTWPAMRSPWPCKADPSRVFDGAEDEATLTPGVPFDVIREPVFRPWRQGEVILFNADNLNRGYGLEIDGQAYFFPLIVMLFHEVANPAFGARQLAVSYCPLTDTGLAFDTGFDPELLPKFHDFAPSGLFNSNVMMSILDRPIERRTLVSQMLGHAVRGPDAGTCPPLHPTILTDFTTWRTLHPETLILVGDEDLLDRYDYRTRPNPYREYWTNDVERRAEVAREDDRLPAKRRVIGVMNTDDPLAVVLGRDDFVRNDRVDGVPVAILNARRTGIVLERIHPRTGDVIRLSRTTGGWRGMPLYVDDSDEPSVWSFDGIAIAGPAEGTRLAWVPSMSSFWFAWYAIYPQTRLIEPSG